MPIYTAAMCIVFNQGRIYVPGLTTCTSTIVHGHVISDTLK